MKSLSHAKRLTQCYESGNVWCYYDADATNSCGCGSNCYHYEYDEDENTIYGVCNGCNKEIYKVAPEDTDKWLREGKWLNK